MKTLNSVPCSMNQSVYVLKGTCGGHGGGHGCRHGVGMGVGWVLAWVRAWWWACVGMAVGVGVGMGAGVVDGAGRHLRPAEWHGVLVSVGVMVGMLDCTSGPPNGMGCWCASTTETKPSTPARSQQTELSSWPRVKRPSVRRDCASFDSGEMPSNAPAVVRVNIFRRGISDEKV